MISLTSTTGPVHPCILTISIPRPLSGSRGAISLAPTSCGGGGGGCDVYIVNGGSGNIWLDLVDGRSG